MDLILNILTRFARASWHLTLAGIVFVCGTATVSAQQQSPIATTLGTLFVMGSYSGNNTQILDSHDHQIATIPEYGYEAVGSDGTVYVARLISGYSTNTLDLFAPPYKKRSATLTYGGFGMSGVATDPQHGMFAVTGNWMVSPLGGPGFIRLYKDGTTKQCSYVPFPGGNVGGSSTFDREGTFYAYAYQAPLLVSVAGGCKATQFILHRLPPGTIPSSLAFDNNNHLILQQYSSNVVTIHAHPGYGPVGPPIATTTLQDIGGKIPHFICLTGDGKHLWADTGSSIGEYLYPQGGAPIVVIRESAKYGLLAVFPPFKF